MPYRAERARCGGKAAGRGHIDTQRVISTLTFRGHPSFGRAGRRFPSSGVRSFYVGDKVTNSVAQIVGGVIIVSSAVVSFLLAQTGVEFDPTIQLILGAVNVALTTLGLYLNVRMPGQSGLPQ